MPTPGAASESPESTASSQDVQEEYHPDQIMRWWNPAKDRPMTYTIEAKIDKCNLQGPFSSLLLHIRLSQMIMEDAGYYKWKEVSWVAPRDGKVLVTFETEHSDDSKELKSLSLADEAPIASTVGAPTPEDDAYYARNPYSNFS